MLVAQAAFISPASNMTKKLSEGDYSFYELQHANWSFKESIMQSLEKAVNVITGGVTILKGELIKGGGALAITLGKVIEVEGDAKSNPGKEIISSTTLGNKQNRTVVHPVTSRVNYGPPSTDVPKSYGAHKYPSQMDGRKKRISFHAGLFLPPSINPDTELITQKPLDPPFRTVDWWK